MPHTPPRLLAIFLALLLAGAALAQQPRSRIAEQTQRRSDDILKEAFRPVVAEARKSVVTVRSGGKDVAMGTIVAADGWIITKASELGEKLVCRFADGRDLPAKLIASSETHDLALLKIDASTLPVVTWSDTSHLQLGQWLASVGTGPLPLATGVLSVGRRSIPSHGAMLGIQLDESDRGPKVLKVVDDSGAAKAGVKINDVILEVAGNPTPTRDDLLDALQQHRIGTALKVKIFRDGKEQELSITLGKRPATTQPSRSEIMNSMGGPLSLRNNGFPDVVQHDSVLKPADCGSPLVDLDGRVIGLNIARAGRTESYAIPADVVKKVVDELKPAGTTKPK
ncbi:MAG: PDZ domain-containing protein [Tepidisphaeraceae bacterium]|jgi:serine protease Do